MAKYNAIMNALAEVVYREMRRKESRMERKAGEYIYDVPNDIPMVAEKEAPYGIEGKMREK